MHGKIKDRVTERMRGQIVSLWHGGFSIALIVKRFDLNFEVVKGVLLAAGIQTRRRPEV